MFQTLVARSCDLRNQQKCKTWKFHGETQSEATCEFSVPRNAFEDCHITRDITLHRLDREGKNCTLLKHWSATSKDGRFSGPKTAPFPLLFSEDDDREWGQKYNSNIFPSAAQSRSSPFDQPRKIVIRQRRPKPKEAQTLDRKKDFCRSPSTFLNPQLFSDPYFCFLPIFSSS